MVLYDSKTKLRGCVSISILLVYICHIKTSNLCAIFTSRVVF